MMRRSATVFTLVALAAAISWQAVAADDAAAAAAALQADSAPTITAAVTYRLQGARKHLLAPASEETAAATPFAINAEGARTPGVHLAFRCDRRAFHHDFVALNHHVSDDCCCSLLLAFTRVCVSASSRF